MPLLAQSGHCSDPFDQLNLTCRFRRRNVRSVLPGLIPWASYLADIENLGLARLSGNQSSGLRRLGEMGVSGSGEPSDKENSPQ